MEINSDRAERLAGLGTEPSSLKRCSLATVVLDTAPVDLRGTAHGLFNLMSGLAMLVASGLAGWQRFRHGPSSILYAGAVFCAFALGILILKRSDNSTAHRAG